MPLIQYLIEFGALDHIEGAGFEKRVREHVGQQRAYTRGIPCVSATPAAAHHYRHLEIHDRDPFAML